MPHESRATRSRSSIPDSGSWTFLGIEARDVGALIARQPFWKRRLVRANLQHGAAIVNIPQSSVRIDLRELRRGLERRRGSSRS